jgi:hypothetical protein
MYDFRVKQESEIVETNITVIISEYHKENIENLTAQLTYPCSHLDFVGQASNFSTDT